MTNTLEQLNAGNSGGSGVVTIDTLIRDFDVQYQKASGLRRSSLTTETCDRVMNRITTIYQMLRRQGMTNANSVEDFLVELRTNAGATATPTLREITDQRNCIASERPLLELKQAKLAELKENTQKYTDMLIKGEKLNEQDNLDSATSIENDTKILTKQTQKTEKEKEQKKLLKTTPMTLPIVTKIAELNSEIEKLGKEIKDLEDNNLTLRNTAPVNNRVAMEQLGNEMMMAWNKLHADTGGRGRIISHTELQAEAMHFVTDYIDNLNFEIIGHQTRIGAAENEIRYHEASETRNTQYLPLFTEAGTGAEFIHEHDTRRNRNSFYQKSKGIQFANWFFLGGPKPKF